MKPCTRFHFEDVEVGDKLFLSGEWGAEPQHPDGVTVRVRRRFDTRNFGPVIEDNEGESYYLNDYDIIRYVPE